MTEEQFDALERWILSVSTMPEEGVDINKRYSDARNTAREAFLGKTHEQPTPPERR